MSKLKILIVDDEEDYCLILKTYFLQRNCDVFISHSLHTGIDMLHEIQPQVLFLDNNLPDGNGWDHVNHITEKLPALNVYLVSAHRHRGDVKNNSPLITVWEKPITLTLLQTVVTRHSQVEQKESR